MPTPAHVVADFQKQVASALDLHDELLLSIAHNKKNKSLESMLAEQCVLGVAVLWEAFIHDLIVSYIEQRSDECVRFHKDKVTQAIEAKSKIFLAWIAINVPAALTRADIEMMVDPKGWHITADSAETLAKTANQLLSAAHAKKFSLPDADRKFVDLTIAIRNYLSHRSTGSLSIMKQKLAELAKADKKSPLKGAVPSVGAYLKTIPKGAPESRTKVISRSLSTLAGKLI
jgi:hypothetical protein